MHIRPNLTGTLASLAIGLLCAIAVPQHPASARPNMLSCRP